MPNVSIWIWLGVIIFFAILEAATVQLVAIWFIAGSVAAFICALLQVDPLLQAIVFVVVSALFLLLLRPLLKKRTEVKDVPTNADMLIGRTAVVHLPIDNLLGTGRVLIESEDWAARSLDGVPLDKGTCVTVHAIDGVKLIVSKMEGNQNA